MTGLECVHRVGVHDRALVDDGVVVTLAIGQSFSLLQFLVTSAAEAGLEWAS